MNEDIYNGCALHYIVAVQVADIIKRNEAEIKNDVLCEDVCYGDTCADAKEWTLNGEKVVLGVVKK